MGKKVPNAPRDAASDPRIAPPASAANPHEFLQEVLDRLPQGVVTFSRDGKVLLVNQRYSEIYRLPPEQIQPGLSLRDLFSLRMNGAPLDEKAQRNCDRLLTSIREGKVVATDFTTREGRVIHCINSPLPTGGWIVTHEDVTDRREAERRIEHLANHDPLTDLPNRTVFRAHLEQALRINPRGRMLALLFVDIDSFKTINDTLGHRVGDELLKTVSERLRGCIRDGDVVARFGADEFVIACPALERPSEAADLAARIREAILTPCTLLGHEVVVDSTIGIALSPSDGTCAEDLLKNADLALHSAKGSGRGAYRFFESEMDTRMTERRNLEVDLRAAYVGGEFELYYQPLLNLERNAVSCCEALLRWRHPLRGMVSPMVFIPIAEEIGLISRIGEWVIRTACAEAAKWPEDVTIAVNVSPVQFRSQNLVQVVAHALGASGLAPERLEIEITEAILLDQTEATLGILRQLRALGVHIAMDDFGTGYSSLSYLQKFPFDKIKIDQAFITDLREDGESHAIVRAVTGIARSFNMATTAEGVETEAQRAIVAELGCTEMQGNLFSAARPAREIARLLAAHQKGRRAA